MQIPNEFFTVTSLGTLGGSVLGVFVITSGVGYLMPADKSLKYKKYISLGLSFVFAFVAAALVSDKTWVTWFVAFVNAWLIFLTAVGANSVFKQREATTPEARAYTRRRPSALPTTEGMEYRMQDIGEATPTIAHGKFRDPWL
jgi:hypothetical protein